MRYAAISIPISIVLVFALSAPASSRGPLAGPGQKPVSQQYNLAALSQVPAVQPASRYSAMHRVALSKPRKLTPPQPVTNAKTVKTGKLVPTRAVIKIKQTAKPKAQRVLVRSRARLVAAVNLSTQRMSVKIDGVTKGVWKISSGKAGFITPRGTYTPYRMHTMWRSRKYNNAKMPHSVFYSGGFAVHATYATRRLGAPASHGCVRLSPRNARKFFNLVKKYGRKSTRISISGTTPHARTYARRSKSTRRRRAKPNTYRTYRTAKYRSAGRAQRTYARRPQSKGFFEILFD